MSPPESTPTVAAHGLTRHYGAHLSVGPLDIELHRGEVLGLLGPNGAGKSTTLRMLTGHLAPSAGEVRIAGIDLLDSPRKAKAHLGYAPEVPPLYRELTVDEYLDFCARLHRLPRRELRQARERAKARCGLKEVGSRLIGHLSKGYQQRLGIAQAILHEPDVIILDEPTAGLDPNQMREVRALIRELGQRHSVILSSHILPEVEAVCDRVLILHRGRVVFHDRVEALKHPATSAGLILGLKRPPPLETLQGLFGITAVECKSDGLFHLRLADGAQVEETLCRLAVENDWGLFRLCPEHTTLEDVFVELTGEDAEAKPIMQNA